MMRGIKIAADATHDIRLLQGEHHLLRPKREGSAENAEEAGRTRPERQRVAARDKLDLFAECGANLVREIAPPAAEGQHSKVVILERPVLDQRQQSMLGAASGSNPFST